MQFGKLSFVSANEQFDLVAQPTQQAITQLHLSDVLVSEINPELSDTAAFANITT